MVDEPDPIRLSFPALTACRQAPEGEETRVPRGAGFCRGLLLA